MTGYRFTVTGYGIYGLRFLFSAHGLMMLYICLFKVQENIFDGFKFIEWTRFPY